MSERVRVETGVVGRLVVVVGDGWRWLWLWLWVRTMGCWELEQGVGASSGGVAATRFVPVMVIVTAVVVMDDAFPVPGARQQIFYFYYY